MEHRKIVRLAVFEKGSDKDQDGCEFGEHWPILNLGEDDDGRRYWLTTHFLRASEVADCLDPVFDLRALGEALAGLVNMAHADRMESIAARASKGWLRLRFEQNEVARRKEQDRRTRIMHTIGDSRPDLCWSDVVSHALFGDDPSAENADEECKSATSCSEDLEPGRDCYCGRWRKDLDGTLSDAQTMEHHPEPVVPADDVLPF